MPTITKPMDDWAARQMRHAYMASVSWLDHQIGRVLQELNVLGLENETMVVLHGDHGWQA
jgi:arylsulfatase A-like enzyme